MAWPMGPGWRDAVQARTAQVVTKVEILEPSGALAALLDVSECSVDVDGTRDVRRQLTMTVPADTPRELLDPRTRREVRAWLGLHFPGEVKPRLAPLGTFSPSKPDWGAKAGEATTGVRVVGYDRGRRFARLGWTARKPIAAGTNVAAAIAAVIEDRWPGLPYDLAPTDVTTPAMWLGIDERVGPWQDLASLAASAAQEVVIDPMGTLTTRPVPDPATAATVAAFLPGPGNTLTSVGRGLDDEDTYSVVILTAEGTGVAAMQSIVKDEDPNSPTYVGAYGEVPYRETTSIAPDQASLDAAAAALFRQKVSLTEHVQGEIVPDPSLDAGDVLEVLHPETGVAGKFLLDTFTVSFAVGDPMPVGLRERRVL